MPMFQTTRWSAQQALSRARRLRGIIALTFGTIAGGRNNLACFRLLLQSRGHTPGFAAHCPFALLLFRPDPGRFGSATIFQSQLSVALRAHPASVWRAARAP